MLFHMKVIQLPSIFEILEKFVEILVGNVEIFAYYINFSRQC